MRTLAILSVLVTLPWLQSPALGQQPCGSHLIQGSSVGRLKVGQSVPSIRKSCRILRDTVMRIDEGQPPRILSILIGRDTVRGVISRGTLWRIDVRSSAFRTPDSLGVGTPLHDLLEYNGVHGTAGEGWLSIFIPSKCGIEFGMPMNRHFSTWDLLVKELRSLPSTLRIEEVRVRACPKRTKRT